MQWLSPWAWSGLVLIAVPIAVHMFSRRPPRVVAFPSLRFLRPTALQPTQRARISDLALLVIRVAIVAAAVAALSQPVWNGTARHARAGSIAVVIDTTLSAMIPEDSSIISVQAGDSSSGVVDATSSGFITAGRSDTLFIVTRAQGLEAAIGEAANWLHTQPAPRTLSIRSRFPRSAVDSLTFMAVPEDVTLNLISRTAHAGTPGYASHSGITTVRDTLHWVTSLDPTHAAVVVTAVYEQGGAVVQWLPALANVSNAEDTGVTQPRLYTAVASAVPVLDSVTTDAAQAVMRLTTLAEDPTLRALALGEIISEPALSASPSDSVDHAWTLPLLFDSRGRTAAVGGLVRGQPIVISHLPERPSLAIATLLALSDNVMMRAHRRPEGIDTSRIDAATLARWQSLPSAPSIGIGLDGDVQSTATDARWLWLVALLLLGLEWILRRSMAGGQ